MSYHRVLPRDLFNESKVLKCYGRLSLILHDHEGQYPITLKHRSPKKGFTIVMDDSSGDLSCLNLVLVHKSGKPIKLGCAYNSKYPYPMYFEFGDYYGEPVFDDNGEFSEEFLDAIGNRKN